MIRNLLVFSGIAAVLSVGCLAGAAALVSHDLGSHDWTWSVFKDGDHIAFRKGPAVKPESVATKALDWKGGDHLSVEIPGEVDYTQGPAPSITVTGPASLVDRVRFDNGKLYFIAGAEDDQPESVNLTLGPDGFGALRSDRKRLRVTVTAPSVTGFDMVGDGHLSLHNYDQPKLDLDLSGSGDVDGMGHTKALSLTLSGSGDADLGDLVAADAKVAIRGSGDADINATHQADIDISGSGDVSFSGKPVTVNTNITGSGNVDGEDNDGED